MKIVSRAAAPLMVLMLIVSGCGDDDTPTDKNSLEVEFKLGGFLAATTVLAGLEDDAFSELDMEFVPVDSGPAALPLVKNGDLAGIADVSAPPMVIAANTGVDVTAVWATTASIVKIVGQPSITSAADLEGKKVAVVAGSILEAELYNYLGESGLGLGDVEIVDMPPPSMGAALKTDQIDAAVTWEPFWGPMIDEGGTELYSNTNVGLVIVGDEFVEDHPAVVQEIVCGFYATHEKFVTDPDSVYAGIAARIDSDAETVKSELPGENVMPADQAVPELLGDGSGPSELATYIATVGEYLADTGNVEAAPTAEEAQEWFDPSFAKKASEGGC